MTNISMETTLKSRQSIFGLIPINFSGQPHFLCGMVAVAAIPGEAGAGPAQVYMVNIK